MCRVLHPGLTNERDSLRSLTSRMQAPLRWPSQSLGLFQTFAFWCPANALQFSALENYRAQLSAHCPPVPTFLAQLQFDRADSRLCYGSNVTSDHPASRLCLVCNLCLLRIRH